MIEIILKEEDDRVVTLHVTDMHGEVYNIGLEFLNHHFSSDEVHISCYKLPRNYKEEFEKHKSCECFTPNRILHNEKTIDIKDPGKYGEGGTDDHRVISSVWFEFHPIKAKSLRGNEVDLPAVKS